MNAKDSHRTLRRSDDPDATSELPQLGAAEFAEGDHWAPPPPVRGTLVDEVLQAHENEIHLLRRELALSARQRATFERQYNEAIETGEEYRQQLSAAEARADELARQLNELERALEDRDVRIGELQLDLDDASTGQGKDADARAGAHGVASPAAKAAPTPARAEPAAQAAHGARGADEGALRGLYAELEQLRWRVAAQSEALQTRESRRVLHAADWQELEGQLAEANRRLAEREARLESLGRELAAARLAPAATAATAGTTGAPLPGSASVASVAAPVAAGDPADDAHAAGAHAGSRRDAHGAHLAHDAAAAAPPAARAPAPQPPAAQLSTPPAGAPPARPGADGAHEAPTGHPVPAPAAEGAHAPHGQATAPAHGGAPAGARGADTGSFAATGDFASTGNFSARATPADGDGLVRLLVRQDGDAPQAHVLGRRTTIGRTPDNDLRIPADWISRHHAVVLQTAAGTVLEDLNSTNGVTVNGLRVARRQLADGDFITFGKSTFRFEIREAAAAAAGAAPARRPDA